MGNPQQGFPRSDHDSVGVDWSVLLLTSVAVGALRRCTAFRQPCGIILERGLPLYSQSLNGGLMPQCMVLGPRDACCTTWHPGNMVQVAAFPLTSRDVRMSQGGPGDGLQNLLLPAESTGSNGERRQERETRDPFPYFTGQRCGCFHGFFLVIEATFRTPCPNCRAKPFKVLAAAPRPRKKGRFRVAIWVSPVRRHYGCFYGYCFYGCSRCSL